MAIDSFPEAEAYLLQRINYERAPTIPYQEKHLKLERMHDLLARIDSPHLGFPCLHVAGTKGKGSTCAMLTEMLRANGFRVGTYTSPHFQSVLERLAIHGESCAPDVFVELIQRIRPAIEAMDAEGDPANQPTYFEILTALAFLYFRESNVDLGVLEVGLGGRLDSTNVCHPLVSVITSISLDHMLQLGNDLVSIAREKGGIIKPGIPLVSGVRASDARRAIQQICLDRGSPLVQIGSDFSATYHADRSTFDYSQSFATQDSDTKDILLALRGEHQADNAAVAWATMDVLRDKGWSIESDRLRQGLSQVAVRGRIEVIGHDPIVILDTAHNSASVRALLDVLRLDYPDRHPIFVFGTTRGKDVDGMLTQLAELPGHLLLTNYHNNPRSFDAHQLAKVLDTLPTPSRSGTGRIAYEVIPDCQAAWQRAESLATRNDLICVFGSFFLIAELEETVRASCR